MDYLAVADVDGYMVYLAAAACVEYQIARTHVAGGNCLAHFGLGSGIMRQGYTELFHDLHGESGTVHALCQAGSAPYIRVAHKLKGVIHHLGTPGCRIVGCHLGR